jgi:hypothetical protein
MSAPLLVLLPPSAVPPTPLKAFPMELFITPLVLFVEEPSPPPTVVVPSGEVVVTRPELGAAALALPPLPVRKRWR